MASRRWKVVIGVYRTDVFLVPVFVDAETEDEAEEAARDEVCCAELDYSTLERIKGEWDAQVEYGAKEVDCDAGAP